MEPTLLELVPVPAVEHRTFRQPPVALVVCQVRFPDVPAVDTEEFVRPFREALASRYPQSAAPQEIHFEIGLEPAAPEIRGQRRKQLWQFTDTEDNWKVVLTRDFLAFETRVYRTFAEFLERLREALQALLHHVEPSTYTRIGLRYIDEIRLAGLAPTDVVRPELLGLLAAPELGENVAQSVQELRLRYLDGQGISIRHGYLPSGTTVQPRHGQEPPTDPFYLLDWDAFRQTPPDEMPTFDVDTICRYVKDYNRVLYRLFRWAITDKYVARMGSE